MADTATEIVRERIPCRADNDSSCFYCHRPIRRGDQVQILIVEVPEWNPHTGNFLPRLAHERCR